MLLVDRLIARFPKAKKTTLKQMLDRGRVLVNGVAAKKLKQEVEEGDRVEVLDRADRGAAPEKIALPPFEIVHEDGDVIVILKPPGLITSAGPKEKRATVAEKLEEYLAQSEPGARVGVIHRLDRDASGLLVFSKNTKAYHHLKAQFFHHTVEREYTAVVAGTPTPKSGRIENYLNELKSGKVIVVAKGEGQVAVTEYETLATAKVEGEKVSLLKIRLLTGRKHQIRVQLAGRKTAILGDEVYGKTERPTSNVQRSTSKGGRQKDERLMLAATKLEFEHPGTGKRMTFEIRAPKEMGAIFGAIEARRHEGTEARSEGMRGRG